MTVSHSMVADRFEMSAAPMRIGRVRLRVRDLALVSTFYRSMLGLSLIGESRDRTVLGTGTAPLLELIGDPGLAPRDPRQAGLFHTAFLLPSRSDLARWFAFATENSVALEGATDHTISEAIYLADPEGNGIEIYADRPPSGWSNPDGGLRLSSRLLDGQNLLRAADGTRWTGFPEGGIVGHIHLQVGDTRVAEDFFRDVLGFDVTARIPNASFFGSGGYHHQIGSNTWNSRGAGARPEHMAGLESFEIVLRDPAERAGILARAAAHGVEITPEGAALKLRDPWGTMITVTG
ncbi:VOC family protein [Halodurantibacterium flavum]|uniref:VOC family protein n=1 Tax=Halodurantibacterium flavum TaxID=1382802 RepID=A0ABW4S9S4_9RHOB